MSLNRVLEERLAAIRAADRYRARRVLDSPAGAEVVIGDQSFVNFSSNDYLGLASHPEVVAALRAGAERWGVGSGAAHLLFGHQAPHHALEEALADFTGRPRALLFSTGYMANLGIISALLGRGDTVLEDRLNHASLIDAGLLSRARLRRYRHADSADLARHLAEAGKGHRLVVTDGVFSMDGDVAPLRELAVTCARHEAWLMVDDAHGFGVLGAQGGGSVQDAGLGPEEVPILMGTLGKAFGTFGAFVAGSEALIETLIQAARSYIYTTALPAALAEATLASLRLAREESWRREKLRALIDRFRQGAAQLGLPLLDSATPIQPILLGTPERAVEVSARLREAGLLVGAIRPPTVPAGTSRLRITLSAAHDEARVDRLLDALATAIGGAK